MWASWQKDLAEQIGPKETRRLADALYVPTTSSKEFYSLIKPFHLEKAYQKIAYLTHLHLFSHYQELLKKADEYFGKQFENAVHRPEEAEAWFLKSSALLQIGKKNEANQIWKEIRRRLWQSPFFEEIETKIEIEEGVIELNSGNYHSAKRTLERALSYKQLLNTTYLLHGLGALTIVYVQFGRWTCASRLIQRYQKIISTYPFPNAKLKPKRLKLLLEVARENWNAVNRILSSCITGQKWITKDYLLFSAISVEVCLRKIETKRADLEIANLESAADQIGLSHSIINIPEYKLELALLKSEINEAHLIATKNALAKARTNKDYRAQTKLLLYCGLARLHLKSMKIDYFEEAYQIAKQKGLIIDLLQVLFHYAGAAYLSGNLEKAKSLLLEGKQLAQELSIDFKSDLFDYIYSSIGKQGVDCGKLSKLLFSKESQTVLAYYLDTFGFLEKFALLIKTSSRGERTFSEKDFRKFIFDRPCIAFFPQSKSILFTGTTWFRSLDLKDCSWNILNHLINVQDLITIEQVHASYSPKPYHSLRHQPAARNAIFQFRQDLECFGIQLVFDRNRLGYRMVTKLPVFSIRPLRLFNGNKRLSRLDRKAQIVSILADRSEMTTSELIQHTSISRQALHPILKELISENRLRVRGKGPGTIYCKKA